MPQSMHHRWMQIGAAVAVGAAGIGFLTGIRGAPVPQGLVGSVADASPREGLQVAPRYADLRSFPKPGRQRYAMALARMRADHDPATAERSRDPEAWRRALRARMERRAYEGAPPRSPHPVDGVEAAACPTCHRDGMKVFGKVAPPMPHAAYANCQQCHASEQPLAPRAALPVAVSEENDFVGLPPAANGDRAYEGAPPQIPHPSFLREHCTSCHGVWSEGLRTSHPWRQNCLQCHALAADADQRPLAPLGGEGVPPQETPQ